MTFGLFVLAAGIVAGVGCAAVGVVWVLAAMLPLKRRLDTYRELPILTLAKTTQARLTLARGRIIEVPRLRARARSAFIEIVTAVGSIRDAAAGAVAAVRATPGFLLGLQPDIGPESSGRYQRGPRA